MVISLSSERAYNYLKNHGFVFSIRLERRKNPYKTTWVNRGRGEEKVCDAAVAEMKEIDKNDKKDMTLLRNLAICSGFFHLSRWKEEILELNDLDHWEEVPDKFYMYLITEIDKAKDNLQ